MINKAFFSGILLLLMMHTNAQSVKEYIKWNPANDSTKVLEGQGWTGEVNNFYGAMAKEFG